MQFSKEDLSGHHYSWPEENNKSLYTGEPSRRLFDRLNGPQVLFMINYFGALTGRFTREAGKKIEGWIAVNLPPDIKSEISVFHWLRELYSLPTETN